MAIYILLFALAVILMLIAVLIFNAARVKKPQQHSGVSGTLPPTSGHEVEHLSQLIKIKTISHRDAALDDEGEFLRFEEKLCEIYKDLLAHCQKIECGNKSILLRIEGESSANPSVLMAHYDVVEANDDEWQHPPFCGEVIDGELWGRGTIDTKISLLSAMEGAQSLIKSGFKPQNDIYLAFAGDEEVAGHGATDIIAYLKKNGVKPAFVLDEGGAIVNGVVPGMGKQMALIGLGEKGQMNAKFTARGTGGHSSRPTTPSLLGKVSRAVIRCEKKPLPGLLTPPVKGLFTAVAPHVPFYMRIVYANMWLFGKVFCALGQTMGSEFNELLRSRLGFTWAVGSTKFNVLPTPVTVGANIRSLNTDNKQKIHDYLTKVVNDKDIEIEFDMSIEASEYSTTDSEQWDKLCGAIGTVWKDTVVAPYLMIAASDSRHYSGYCDNVFRFSPLMLTKDSRKLIHANDERISTDSITDSVKFYIAIIKQL